MRLLLLEDNQDAASTLARALTRLDGRYDVHRVSTLEDALNALTREAWDIALIDLSLPDADGCDAAVAMRAVAPALPLVALTGKDFDAVAVQLVRLGVQDYLQKGSTSIERIHQVLQLAMERHRQAFELSRKINQDSLTGAMTRDAVTQQLSKAMSHAERSGRCGAVMMVDVDDFKMINDGYGHLTGDAVLRDVASRLLESVRRGDSLGRIGGDEFLVILDGLGSREDAVTVAGKASARTNYLMRRGELRVPVSTSIGVAVFPDDATSQRSVLELADRALYQAKRNGKKAFRFHAPPSARRAGAED